MSSEGSLLYKPVSQSCAVATSEKFWRATGQSNLADRMEDCSTGQNAVVRNPNIGSFCYSQPFVPQAECAVARQNFSLLATAHDCERGKISPQHIYQIHEHFAKMSFSDTETGMVVYFLDVPCLWDLVRMQRGLVLLYKINCWKITIMKYI